MKINHISALLLVCGGIFNAAATEIKPSKSWEHNSKAVYDLLVAQMKNSSADFGGSADALVRYAKSQKNDRLYIDAYTALLRTQRYGDAVKLVNDWREDTKMKLDRYHVLALVLNDEVDLAITTIDKKLEDAKESQHDTFLVGYLRILVTHWYNPHVIDTISKMYDNYPDNEVLSMTFVKQLRWQGETDKAISVLDKALFSDAKNIALLNEKSDTYRYSVRTQDAESVWKNILKDYPKNVNFQFAFAKLLFDKYDFAAADELLATIKPDAKQQYSVDFLQVMTKIQLEKLSAIDDVINWKKMEQPEKDSMNFDIATYLLKLKHPKEALQYIDKIEIKNKKGKMALAVAVKKGRAYYHESVKKGDDWFKDLKEEFNLSDTDIVREKVYALQSAELDKEAFELLTGYLEKNPKNDDMRYMRALIAAEMHKDKLAAEELSIIYATSPDNSEVQNALGYTLLSTADGDDKKLKAAGKIIKKALFVQPDSYAVIDSIGWYYYQQKEYKKALPYLRYAYAHYSDGEVIGHYIAALAKAGQLKLAKDLYQLEMQYTSHQEKIEQYTKPVKELLRP